MSVLGRNQKPRAGANGPANNRTTRTDGYVNVLTKYGVPRDSSTAYRFQSEGVVSDMALTEHYEGNGLFAKIIDAPAEEAVKHGFELAPDQSDTEELLNDALDALEWGEKAATAIKWARLYGGAIIVMLIDDGGGLDEPLNREAIRGIDGIRVYGRAIAQPGWTAALYGTPQTYNISSISGYFTVHASRCLVFKNGVVPEHTVNAQYRFWGLPEYLRIRNELRGCLTSHGLAVKLLDRSVQAIYTMKGLATLLTSEDGEDVVLRRLQLIDKSRGILNSIAIDADGENYDFKSVTFAGVKDIIDTTCNMLSAVTNIPQTILFGRSPAGMNATGQGDLENYYNLCERIQRMMLYGNLKTLAGIIFAAAYAKGELAEKQVAKIKFKPLWSLSETEQATVEQTRATASQTKAQTAQIYVDMGSLDPSEVRKGLAKNKEFDIEKLLDDMPEDDLMEGWDDPALFATVKSGASFVEPEQASGPAGVSELASEVAEASDVSLNGAQISSLISVVQTYNDGMLERDSAIEIIMSVFPFDTEKAEKILGSGKLKGASALVPKQGNPAPNEDGKDTSAGVGVLILNDTGESVLCGKRTDDKLICGAGGHIQEGETPTQAAIRETQEEFGITPLNLRRLGQITNFAGGKYGEPVIYLCTEYEGEPKGSEEIQFPCFFPVDEFEPEKIALFPPFAESLKLLAKV